MYFVLASVHYYALLRIFIHWLHRLLLILRSSLRHFDFTGNSYCLYSFICDKHCITAGFFHEKLLLDVTSMRRSCHSADPVISGHSLRAIHASVRQSLVRQFISPLSFIVRQSLVRYRSYDSHLSDMVCTRVFVCTWLFVLVLHDLRFTSAHISNTLATSGYFLSVVL